MKGKPKFKLGDMVEFEWQGETKVGEIYIVDKYEACNLNSHRIPCSVIYRS